MKRDWSELYQTARNKVLSFNDLLVNGKTEEAYSALTVALDSLDDLYSMAVSGELMLSGKPVDFSGCFK
jgi:hypothetical protein